MSKKLVAYFSCSGVTAEKAGILARIAGADLFEIRPEVPYTRADLDWTNPKSRSSLEMKGPSSRPGIAGRVDQMETYDVVFVGFPIWWYVAPTIIDTFLESYDFSGKTLIAFATSGGSGLGKTETLLKERCPDAVWKKGKLLNGMTEAAIAAWVKELNLG